MNPRRKGLEPTDLGSDPIAAFRRWFDDAAAAQIPMPEAVALATAGLDARPSLRWVLLKGVSDRGGFDFYTNYESRKARELLENPRAALAVWWQPLDRQVRIEGRVDRVPTADSAAYWHSRHRASQISTLTSRQSEPVADRAAMDRVRGEAEKLYAGREVPRPEHWGGYRLTADAIEFWQGRDHRFHDRIRFTKDGDGAWEVTRLWP